MISVIIPAYNCAHLIPHCLQSLQAQSFQDFEAIIIDNHSTDDLKQVIEKFQDPRFQHHLFHNHGVIAASRNYGITLARFDLIAFLDADDLWYSNKLSLGLQGLQTADLIYHDLDYFDPEYKRIPRKFKSRRLGKDAYVDLLCKGNTVATSSVMVKKSVITAAGAFTEEPDLIAVEDFHLWLKLAKAGYKLQKLEQDSLGGYWLGPGASRNYMKQIERTEALYKKHLPCLGENAQSAEATLAYLKAEMFLKAGAKDMARIEFKKALLSPNWKFKIKALKHLLF